MLRRTLPVFVFALAVAAPPAGAVATTSKRPQAAPSFDTKVEFEQPDAREMLRQAKDLWLIQEDFTGALAKFNAVVKAYPDDNDARLQRAHFFEVLSVIVVERDRAKFAERARSDFDHIIADDPESLIAGVARDGLTRLSGEALLASKIVVCSQDATSVHGRASALYGARRYAEAAAEYARAAASCPDNANWWVELADSFYELEDYEKAKAHFVKALSVDPWNREAHRYLSDTYVQLGDNETAVRELMLAVVSDPQYEAGWSALRAYGSAMGLKWSRVYGDRRMVPANPDGTAWGAYAAARANARQVLGKSAPALAVEREAVKAALKTASSGHGPFWSMLARAERGGFLDEAIFLHLLDPTLAAEYPAFREANAARLTSYLETVILQ